MCLWTIAVHVCGIRGGELGRNFCARYNKMVEVVVHPANDPPSQAIQDHVMAVQRRCNRITQQCDRAVLDLDCLACIGVVRLFILIRRDILDLMGQGEIR
jgi:hypothetical protein